MLWLSTASALPRVPNTTLALPAGPVESGYSITNAFGSLSFPNPVVVVAPPGETNRLFIVEQTGIVSVITNLAAPTRTVFLDISSQIVWGGPGDERGLLGLAFHPRYASNGQFFVYYSTTQVLTTNLDGTLNSGLHECLSRFTVSAGDPNTADPASELRLLAMADNYPNHNGGCLQFGPDGYLYLGTGDEGGSNDTGQNSQRIDKNLWSGLLRLDVDLAPGSVMPTPHAAQRFTGWGGSVNYRLPPDNPFLGATSFNGVAINTNLLRGEFYAVGLRNPWRFSFDPLDDRLYLADVGQNAVEEIDLVTAGGNYGWAVWEGNIPGPNPPPAGLTNAIAPILTYTHGSGTNQGNCVIGGVVYRGGQFPDLYGQYVFADYVSGNIWAAQPNGTNLMPFVLLTTHPGITSFGVDPRNGDVLLCDLPANTIQRLVNATTLAAPALLSDTGAFTNLAALAPSPGVVPYEVNVPAWTDNARTTHWFSVSDTNLSLTFSAEGNWQCPTGTVWIQHFDLETNTLTHASRRLETRFLVRYTGGVYGLTYRWTIPPTNAVLVADAGLDEPIAINDGGTLRTQDWHYPGRGECLSCHSPAGGGALDFGTLQLNRTVTNGVGGNQIQQLSDAGYFSAPVTGVNALRALAHPTNEAASLEWRARSYLEANCSSCHLPGGLITSWDSRFSTPTRFANLINGTPIDNLGNPSNCIIVPGSTNFSILYTRMSTRGDLGMPPLGSALVDTNGAALLARWITAGLANYQSYAQWQTLEFGSTNAPNSGEMDDYDGDGAKNYLEYLTGTDPLSAASHWGLGVTAGSNAVVTLFWNQPANRAVELQFTPTVVSNATWAPVDAAFNQPFYPASNRPQQYLISTNAGAARFFRARVSEP
jgi:glucose/arabinose dehydrogenase